MKLSEKKKRKRGRPKKKESIVDNNKQDKNIKKSKDFNDIDIKKVREEREGVNIEGEGEGIVKRKRGRPKGCKNKKSKENEFITINKEHVNATLSNIVDFFIKKKESEENKKREEFIKIRNQCFNALYSKKIISGILGIVYEIFELSMYLLSLEKEIRKRIKNMNFKEGARSGKEFNFISFDNIKVENKIFDSQDKILSKCIAINKSEENKIIEFINLKINKITSFILSFLKYKFKNLTEESVKEFVIIHVIRALNIINSKYYSIDIINIIKRICLIHNILINIEYKQYIKGNNINNEVNNEDEINKVNNEDEINKNYEYFYKIVLLSYKLKSEETMLLKIFIENFISLFNDVFIDTKPNIDLQKDKNKILHVFLRNIYL